MCPGPHMGTIDGTVPALAEPNEVGRTMSSVSESSWTFQEVKDMDATQSFSVIRFFQEGGFWMLPILAAQVFSIAIIIERVFALYIRRQATRQALIQSFEEDIKKGNLDVVVNKGRQVSSSDPLGAVVAAGAQAALNLGGREEIQGKMDEVLLVENARLHKRTVFLAMLGNVGTLLGLLGTIVGMITSFGSIASADPIAKANILAAGISEAMNATAYGLVTAIPALVAFTVLQNRAQALFDDLNQGALRMFNLLSFHYESVPAKKVRTGK
ncbi:MAG: MotA/TolQ/ExbB proton channel family protein [Bdellovibrionaceae bacterium]|nr:MotA/TolQ/ExbB proton channel family protein [Pseudobdellovibrionaceae bacterium]